ncbi:unnamed protein product [Onchocerca flexuosa]|uniref:HNHc domain-containing protein n=1 Tax=Onchocerca flexuosa TaxID=387005 RepID=A0A183I0M8_9BILA|nr:unnamed protein product [Onchocerca flexuosa]
MGKCACSSICNKILFNNRRVPVTKLTYHYDDKTNVQNDFGNLNLLLISEKQNAATMKYERSVGAIWRWGHQVLDRVLYVKFCSC